MAPKRATPPRGSKRKPRPSRASPPPASKPVGVRRAGKAAARSRSRSVTPPSPTTRASRSAAAGTGRTLRKAATRTGIPASGDDDVRADEEGREDTGGGGRRDEDGDDEEDDDDAYKPLTEEEMATERDEEALAHVQDTRAVLFKGEDARLTVTVLVLEDLTFKSRRAYVARIMFERTEDGERCQEDTGFILSWRISKPTQANPNVDFKICRDEFIKPSMEAIAESGKETASCLKAIMKQDLTIGKNKIRDADLRRQIDDNPLIFIGMIYIRPEFQNQGLLRPVLEMYNSLLGRLPEWFAFAGTLVLIPAKPTGLPGEVWGADDDDDERLREIEGIPENVYSRHGDYVIYVRDATVEGRFKTVMGRTVPDAPAAAAPAAGDPASDDDVPPEEPVESPVEDSEDAPTPGEADGTFVPPDEVEDEEDDPVLTPDEDVDDTLLATGAESSALSRPAPTVNAGDARNEDYDEDEDEPYIPSRRSAHKLKGRRG